MTKNNKRRESHPLRVTSPDTSNSRHGPDRGNIATPLRVTCPQVTTDNSAPPYQAYAIVGNRDDPATWQLPHHTRQVSRAVQGKIGYEHTVDWQLMERAVQLLSRYGIEGQRVVTDESQVIAASQHLASHYRKAGKPLPDALAVLV